MRVPYHRSSLLAISPDLTWEQASGKTAQNSIQHHAHSSVFEDKTPTRNRWATRVGLTTNNNWDGWEVPHLSPDKPRSPGLPKLEFIRDEAMRSETVHSSVSQPAGVSGP